MSPKRGTLQNCRSFQYWWSMNITMKNDNLSTIEDLEVFLQGNTRVSIKIKGREAKYKFIRDTFVKFNYLQLRKKDRGTVKRYIQKLTHYGDRQLKRLILEWKQGGLKYTKGRVRGAAKPKYGVDDIALLILTDIAQKTRSAVATKETLKREYLVFGKMEYENIARISTGHIYNIRKNKHQYLSSEAIRYTKTQPVSVPIGTREKPIPYGKAGFIRVDSVHQGDKDGEKGVYHINLVDEVTQWEIVGCVPRITDEYMEPLLEAMLEQLPFAVVNFHSDNGSEYINEKVAKILNRLKVKQTKSRPRKSNDQALVEGKNGSVIRKHMGRNFIPKSAAMLIGDFYVSWFNPYLNYHRICSYATDKMDKRGKIRKVYDLHTTPYERLKSLPADKQNLRPGVLFAELDKFAYAESDNEFALNMQEAKRVLFRSI